METCSNFSAFSYKQLVHIAANNGCRMGISKFLRTSKEAYLLIIAYLLSEQFQLQLRTNYVE